jgi:isoleucyl-tRNA synthetase
VPDAQLTGLDRWVLGEFAKLEAAVAAAYDAYEFHVVYQKLSQFAAVELSSIYHDVVKDRLYTDPANSARRRSTQTALHRMVTRLCQMLAPMLAFTADEAWEFIPGKPTPSVHLSEWEAMDFSLKEEEAELWKKLFSVRLNVLPVLEKARTDKLIGKSLDAIVKIIPPGSVESAKTDMQELLNVSQLEFMAGNHLPVINAMRAEGQKCERCWHTETDVGTNTEHPTLCPRCIEAVKDCKAC